jgi:hypothetical protein
MRSHQIESSPGPSYRGNVNLSTIRLINPQGLKACITRSTTCLRRARLAVALERSLPKIAESVGVFEKKK